MEAETVEIDQGDPNYPIEHFRYSSTLRIDIEVVHDGNADHLAEDMAILVGRELESRGFDVWGRGSWAEKMPHRMPLDEAKARGIV